MCNSTAFLCLNLSQEQCTTAALTTGVIDLVTSIISTSLLLCLLLVLKRKAWNSPVKWLTLILTTYIGLSEFVNAPVELYNDILPSIWNEVLSSTSNILLRGGGGKLGENSPRPPVD